MVAHERWSQLDVRLYLQNLRVEKSIRKKKQRGAKGRRVEGLGRDQVFIVT